MHPGDARNAGDAVQQQFLVAVHVAHHSLELVVGILAGDEQAFDDFRDVLDFLLEVLETFRGVAVHGNVDQGHQAQAQLAGVQQGAVAEDQAGLLQRLDPAQAGGGREANTLGQVLVADAAIFLQELEDLAVVAVEFHGVFFIPAS